MYDKDYYCSVHTLEYRLVNTKWNVIPKYVSFVQHLSESISLRALYFWMVGYLDALTRTGVTVYQDSWQIRACRGFLASYLPLHFTKHGTMYCYRKTLFPRIGREWVNSLTYFPETWHTVINRKTKLHYILEKLIKVIDYDKGQSVF